MKTLYSINTLFPLAYKKINNNFLYYIYPIYVYRLEKCGYYLNRE